MALGRGARGLGEGARAAARELAEAELALARGTRVAAVVGRALRVQGLVRGGTEGIEALHQACEVLAGTEGTLERLRAQMDLGSALCRGGTRRDAPEVLAAARARAEAWVARRSLSGPRES